MRESVRHIVGVQFRNCATAGGSIWGRYGYSDVLTMFLALDTWVELYQGGRIPLAQFAAMKKDNDILVNIIVKKVPLSVVYLSQRNCKTDFPVLTCAASLVDGEPRCVIGARPYRAAIMDDAEGILNGFGTMTEEERKEASVKYAEYTAAHVHVGGNMRGSEEYRRLLAKVLTRRAWEKVGGMLDED
jgi:CO/xanthine dehydrogenase FAD-binding subunit